MVKNIKTQTQNYKDNVTVKDDIINYVIVIKYMTNNMKYTW